MTSTPPLASRATAVFLSSSACAYLCRPPEQPSAYHNLDALLLAKDAKAQAIAAFQQAAERGSKTAETYRALIWLYRKTGNEQAAKQAYRLAARHIEDATAGAALSEYWNSGQ